MENALPFYSNSTLRMCQWVPSNLSLKDGLCVVVWPQNNTASGQDNMASNDPNYASTVAPSQGSLSLITPTSTNPTPVLAAASSITSSSSPVLEFSTFIGIDKPTVTSLPASASSATLSTTTVTAVFVASASITRATPTPATTSVAVPTGINNSGNVVILPADDDDHGAVGNGDGDSDDDKPRIIFGGGDDNVGGLRTVRLPGNRFKNPLFILLSLAFP